MAKSLRRDLRRAVGVSVVDTVQDIEESVGGLGNVVNSLRRDLLDLAVDHATVKKDHGAYLDNLGLGLVKRHEHIKALESDLGTFRSQSFLQRFRWLFTGK